MTIPFFAPALSENEVLLKLIQEVATDPAQKFIPGARTGEFERVQRDAADAIACGSGTSALLLAHTAISGEVVCAPLAASLTSPRGNRLFVAASCAFEAGVLLARKLGTHLHRLTVDLVVVR